jgi:hypothetical protein
VRTDRFKLAGGTMAAGERRGHVSHGDRDRPCFDADPGEDYLKLAQPMVDQQLALAGLRLARTLSEIFK